MELSKRLQTVADAVTVGNRVADVGTDHGYVPIYLVKNHLAPGGVAMDVNKGPLKRARENILKEKLSEKIECRLGNGLKSLQTDEADTIIIAGMGGDLICQILKESPEFLRHGKELVLQPQSEWFKVRLLLEDYEYAIRKEWFLKEDGKYYVIIKALPASKGNAQKMTPMEAAYGKYLLEEKNPVLSEYLKKELAKKEKIALGLKNLMEEESGGEASSENNRGKKGERYRELINEIQEIKTIVEL
ncbi:MAG: class I SAM-dependent methyltransferase [Eubacterium sp.]|nr:class I SAM-dependent methyltransferase [Eubacterium sp.]MDD7209276.1 class I SAM-dependent methyltransferase [Lachnospiraceae bacterium]MDY5498458.1 class I SAM-dependent methyltransferase [Anaerobutyricum sp.]